MREAAAHRIRLVIFISSTYVSRADYFQDVEPTSLGWKARGRGGRRDELFPALSVAVTLKS